MEDPVIPAVRRDLDDAVAPGPQVAPERVQVRRVRITPGDADDRDVVGPARGRGNGGHRRRGRHDRRSSEGAREGPAGRRGDQRGDAPRMRGPQMRRELAQRLVLEEQRLGQFAEALLQAPREIRHHQRVEAELFQRIVGAQARRRQLHLLRKTLREPRQKGRRRVDRSGRFRRDWRRGHGRGRRVRGGFRQARAQRPHREAF